MKKFSSTLLSEIEQALDAITFGSIEIYVQDKKVTQITVRNIKKTSVALKSSEEQEKTRLIDVPVQKQRVIEN